MNFLWKPKTLNKEDKIIFVWIISLLDKIEIKGIIDASPNKSNSPEIATNKRIINPLCFSSLFKIKIKFLNISIIKDLILIFYVLHHMTEMG